MDTTQITTFTIGILCIITAVVGGGLNAFGFKFPVLSSIYRQITLAVLGIILIFGGSVFVPQTGSQVQVNITPTAGPTISPTIIPTIGPTITGTTPSITLIYPNGFETWNRGQTYTIRWKSENIEGNVRIYLRGQPEKGGGRFLIVDNTPDNGSYQYTVPTNIGFDAYKMYVVTLDESIKGSSDVFFIPLLTSEFSTPRQIYPLNGTTFSFMSCKCTAALLKWSAVPDAVSYTLEVDHYNTYTNMWTKDSGGFSDIISNISATSYTYPFVGAQPHRWRIWAVDANGLMSDKSGWWLLFYTS